MGVAFGLLGLIAGVGAWFRPAPKPEAPVYSAEQVADAKKAVCAAFENGVRTIEVAGRRSADDPTLASVVAVNTRLALVSVFAYLSSTTQANPAAPPEILGEVQKLANTYQQIELRQLADATREQVASTAEAADHLIRRIKEVCT